MIGVGVRILGTAGLARLLEKGAARLHERQRSKVVEGLALIEKEQKAAMRGSRTRAKRKGRSVTAPPGVLGVDTGRLRQSITSDVWRAGASVVGEVGPQRVPYDFQIGPRSRFQDSALHTTVDRLTPELQRILGEIPEVFG